MKLTTRIFKYSDNSIAMHLDKKLSQYVFDIFKPTLDKIGLTFKYKGAEYKYVDGFSQLDGSELTEYRSSLECMKKNILDHMPEGLYIILFDSETNPSKVVVLKTVS